MSKSLEALEKLRYFDEHILTKDNKFRIMGELDIIEKELKAFKIIVNKRVLVVAIMNSENVKQYNDTKSFMYQCFNGSFDLTQKEYELLREVLL